MTERKFKFERRLLSQKDLVVDYRYQRPVDKARVRKIVRDFNPAIVNTVKVSYRDGRYYIIDGQHTVAALHVVYGDDAMIDCNVFYGMTDKDEANLFYEQNGHSKPVSAVTKFKVKVFNGDDTANAIIKKLSACGMGVDSDGKSSKRNFKCPGELEKQYKILGDAKFCESLSIIKDAWYPQYCPEAVSRAILAGVCTFVNLHFGRYNRTFLIKSLSRLTPGDILRASHVYGYTNGKTVCAAITAEYNKRRSGAHMI